VRGSDHIGEVDGEEIGRRIKTAFMNELIVAEYTSTELREVQVVTIRNHMRGMMRLVVASGIMTAVPRIGPKETTDCISTIELSAI